MPRFALIARKQLREGRLEIFRTSCLYISFLTVLIIDQVTKAIARSALNEGPVRVIPGFFDLVLNYNQGAAFGILPDWTPLFIIVALVFVFAVVRLKDHWASSRGLSIGLGLILGGAIGNLIDRLLFPSRGVTDFLSIYIKTKNKTHVWPTFNIADVAIVVGTLIVFICVFIEKKQHDAMPDKDEQSKL